MNWLALGDSYTVGEGVEASERWSHQLVYKLNSIGVSLDFPEIIAQTGWTTDELLKAIHQRLDLQNTQFDIVSLLIGVNNQYRGYDSSQYRQEFSELLSIAIRLCKHKQDGVFVVGIPDYGWTRFMRQKFQEQEKDCAQGAREISVELEHYNAIARSICDLNGVIFCDIWSASKCPDGEDAGPEEESIWVAQDSLHPSEKMYSRWVELGIWPKVEPLFKKLCN